MYVSTLRRSPAELEWVQVGDDPELGCYKMFSRPGTDCIWAEVTVHAVDDIFFVVHWRNHTQFGWPTPTEEVLVDTTAANYLERLAEAINRELVLEDFQEFWT